MAGNETSWSGSTADRRLFRAVPTLSLTAVGTVPSLNDVWLANVSADAAGAMALDPGGAGSTLRVHFNARDGFSQPSTTPVVISVSGNQVNTAVILNGAAGGTLLATLMNGDALGVAGNYGATLVVQPNATTGLVDVLFTFVGVTTAAVLVQHRHILAAAEVAVAA